MDSGRDVETHRVETAFLVRHIRAAIAVHSRDVELAVPFQRLPRSAAATSKTERSFVAYRDLSKTKTEQEAGFFFAAHFAEELVRAAAGLGAVTAHVTSAAPSQELSSARRRAFVHAVTFVHV